MSAPELNGVKIQMSDLLEQALTIPGSLGSTYNRFYQYSPANYSLIHWQMILKGRSPEPVATFKRFQDMGRQVVKGSKAMSILRPIMVKREDEKGEEHAFTRFKMVKCLFSLSDTEGEPLPEVEPRDWSKERALGVLGLREVPFRHLDGNTQGYSQGNDIAINPVAAYPFKTWLHEAGHIVLGHTTGEGLAEYRSHRGIKEFQAEGTAYLCANELEVTDSFDASESRAYIQDWLQGERPPERAVQQVFSATTKILKAGYAPVAELAEVEA